MQGIKVLIRLESKVIGVKGITLFNPLTYLSVEYYVLHLELFLYKHLDRKLKKKIFLGRVEYHSYNLNS